MPTGSGKTTGAVWGIVDFAEQYPDKRLCFLTPYKEAVETVYANLAKHLGDDIVGYYHSDAFADKSAELSKRIIVLTHSFIEYNQGRLDDRDLFVVDEAIYATGEASLKLQHFDEARSWATSNNIYPEAFVELSDFANELDVQLRESGKKYVAPLLDREFPWAATINKINLQEHSQTITSMDVLVAVQRFCEALLQGLVFLSKGSSDKTRYDPVFSAAVLGIPRIEKTVILSATGGMVYDIAGPFKQDLGSREYWTPPSYERLRLVQLAGPDIAGSYNTWSSASKKDQVTAYVDWLLTTISEPTIYMTMPKKILEGCLRGYLDQQKTGVIEYPIKTTKHGKQLHISHHARSVGSNAFKDCEAVVYLWDNHLPQSVHVQKFHTLADKEITEEALEDANSGTLVGDYSRIRKAQFIDNMMQQVGRGQVRSIDEYAVAAPMTAYVLTEPNLFESLAAQYRGCTTDQLQYEEIVVNEPTGRIARILSYIRNSTTKADIPVKEIEQALGFDLRRYRSQLEGDWDLAMLGYQFQAGEKGRGKAGYFKWLGEQ
ncbi:hypothetical protein DFP92_101866 [Yoonia sediminilitoris]|uniref:Helicase ATP-binding domain-containing protein n=2 Tax=Yoonia sediminilitoris TaxID=1286148 RepID=A0A2T6KRT7_9RHOB|nr:hypothetical protein C8N45_101866 [Yoonia sediminilitoris]RCW99439.1 hypothetical protein DFP92_101866 [Yoonia sediminilitoris]